ncbi:Helicase SKI2W [Hordeum vulgare]|nr:Helicase SKI2W [Hordeum vulgare]
MQDQVGLDSFPLDHEFSEDYGLEEEEDDMDIDGEPLFEEELANRTAAGAKPKRKTKRTKAYTPAEDKLLCECWRDNGQDPKVGAEQKCQVVHVEEVLDYISLFPDYRPGTGSIFYLARKYDETPQPSCARRSETNSNGFSTAVQPAARKGNYLLYSYQVQERIFQCEIA